MWMLYVYITKLLYVFLFSFFPKQVLISKWVSVSICNVTCLPWKNSTYVPNSQTWSYFLFAFMFGIYYYLCLLMRMYHVYVSVNTFVFWVCAVCVLCVCWCVCVCLPACCVCMHACVQTCNCQGVCLREWLFLPVFVLFPWICVLCMSYTHLSF